MIFLNDLLKYLICPYKLELEESTINRPLDSVQTLHSKLLLDALLYKAKNNYLSDKVMHDILNHAWDHVKKNFNDPEILSSGIQNFIYKAMNINKVLNCGEVITINDENIIDVKGSFLKFNIDAIILDTDGTVNFIYLYHEHNILINKNITALLYDYISKTILAGLSKTKYKVLVYSSFFSNFKNCENSIDLKKFKPVLANALNTMINNRVPNPSYICAGCSVSNKCNWKFN